MIKIFLIYDNMKSKFRLKFKWRELEIFKGFSGIFIDIFLCSGGGRREEVADIALE